MDLKCGVNKSRVETPFGLVTLAYKLDFHTKTYHPVLSFITRALALEDFLNPCVVLGYGFEVGYLGSRILGKGLPGSYIPLGFVEGPAVSEQAVRHNSDSSHISSVLCVPTGTVPRPIHAKSHSVFAAAL